MRIGINARVLGSPVFRGLHRYTVNLLREYSRLPDLEIVLFTTTLKPLHPDFLEGIRMRTVVVKAAREALWNDWALPRAIRRERIDVFHAVADRGVPLMRPCPLIVTVHDSFERSHWRDLFPTVKHRLHYFRHEFANWRADGVITVSDTTRKKLIELKVAPASRVHRIYLAAAEEFHPDLQPADAAVLRRYDIHPPYVLYAGGYDPRKNVQALVDAFSRAELPHHTLVISAAKLFAFPSMEAAWRELSCFPRLRLIEAERHEVPALYRQAEFFVNPSMWESFSFQSLEAMASGTPLIASNRTAIPEVVGDAALLFDAADTAGLARLMELVAGDASLRMQLRTRGFVRAKEFSWARTAQETLAIYRSVM